MMPPNLDDDADLERALRQSLRRIEPVKDFSAIQYARKPIPIWTRPRVLLALAAALVLAVLIPAGVDRYQARQRRGEEARAQLVTALRITESKLQKTRQMVVRGLNRRNSI